jgi:tetratricopeptide (TPR) repeat protein
MNGEVDTPLADDAPPRGWGLWQRAADGTVRQLEEDSGGEDLLKVLLARATRLLESDPAALLVLRQDERAGELLEGLAAIGLEGLILDERTAGRVPPPFRCARIGFLPGVLAEPFCAYRLELRRVAAEPVATPARAGIWEEIRGKIRDHEGRGGFLRLGIAGPAGAGKSHLIGAVAALLASDGRTLARVSCLPTDVPGTFTAWRSLLGQIGGERLPAAIAGLGTDRALDPSLVENLVRFLAGSADAPESGLSPLQHKEILPEFIAGTLAQLVAAEPAAAILDDIQWLDEGSEAVIAALERTGAAFVLVLGRRGQPAEEDIALGPMSLEEHRQLLSELSGYARITDELNGEIHRVSHGLPLVSREVFAVLSKRRRLLAMGGTLDLAAEEKSAGSAAAEGMLLTERFRDLSPRLRTLLAACAIWREPFSKSQAKATALACGPGLDFEACWASPLLGEFIVAAPGLPGRFSFYHDLLREAALSLMNGPEKEAGHGAALEWLTAGPATAGSPAVAAFHARESGRVAEAVALFDQAAQAALGRFALREAREAARAALELEPADPAQRARLHQIDGEAAFHWGMVEEAVASLEKALVLYQVSPTEGRFPIGPAVLLRHGWLFASGRPWTAANPSPNLEGAARAALMLAEIAYFQNDQQRSAECCITALDLAAKNGESAALASLCAAIACPMSGKRPRWLAERYRGIARAMISRVGDRTERTYIEHVGCLVDLDKTRWSEAAARAAGNVTYWQSHGHGRRVEEAATHAFYVDYFQGKLGGAAKWAAVLQDSAVKRTDRQSRTWAAMMGSLHALACLGPREAEAWCRQVPADGGDAITQSSIHVMRAICAWRSGNPWQVMQHLRDAEDLAGAHPAVSSTQFLLADAAVLLGEMRIWGPPELAADPAFTGLCQRFLRRAAKFAASFGIGAGILQCAKGLHGGNGTAFLTAERAAERLGAKLIQARARCYRALKSSDHAAFETALALFSDCGADAEITAFRQLESSHERRA